MSKRKDLASSPSSANASRASEGEDTSTETKLEVGGDVTVKKSRADVPVSAAAIVAGAWKGSENSAAGRSQEKKEATLASLDAATAAYLHASANTEVRICPYLDTIDRKVLDFDFEKQCSISLATVNVYVCLVCGKYLQGRGKGSYAYLHSLEEGHHVYVNLQTLRFYCLPDGYMVEDPSLEDILYNIKPTFTQQSLAKITEATTPCLSLHGVKYFPGIVGLNNIKKNDWFNAVAHLLAQVIALRNFFLFPANYEHSKSNLVQVFGEFMRKMWSARNFKGHVSPHEILQVISTSSEKKFRIGEQADPVQFISWLLNTLHKDLGGTRKPGSSIIHKCFQGELVITTAPAPAPAPAAAATTSTSSSSSTSTSTSTSASTSDSSSSSTAVVTARSPFLMLSFPLQTDQIFADPSTNSFIKQVRIAELLERFNGINEEILPDGSLRTFGIAKLPQYLIVHVNRFKNNGFFIEKNNTLVTFPLKGLDMSPCIYKATLPSMEELLSMPASDLQQRLRGLVGPSAKHALLDGGAVEKRDLAEEVLKLMEAAQNNMRTKYDLVANIVHDGKAGEGTYKCHLLHRATNKWYEAQDLRVWTEDAMSELVALSQTLVQLYERK